MRSYLYKGIGVLLLFLAAGLGLWVGTYAVSVSGGSGSEEVFIPKGSGVRQIQTLLASRGLIRDDIRFQVLTKLTGKGARLRAGEYRIPHGVTPLQVLDILEKGQVVLHKVTIPEGLTSTRIGTLLADDGWVETKKFAALVADRSYIRSLGIDAANLEGYLFPDTYTLVRGEDDEKTIIRMMVKRFRDVWRQIDGTEKYGLKRHQLVTLASIVEKETGAAEERPLIARVFLNRLARGMRLQSDPTVIYGLDDFNGNLTRKDLRNNSPYNTYVIAGLPPGPICNPGKAALEAVLRPAEAPYLYFVSKNQGTHFFSSTLKEHNRAVKKYQQAGITRN